MANSTIGELICSLNGTLFIICALCYCRSSFVLLDDDGRMITQRQCPRLALIKTEFLSDGVLQLSDKRTDVEHTLEPIKITWRDEAIAADKILEFKYVLAACIYCY